MGGRIEAWRAVTLAAAIAAGLAVASAAVAPLLPVRPAAAAEELALGREQVRELQRRLKEEGFDPGPVDGIVGRKTRAAIRRFREARGLGSDAGIDAPLLEALGMRTAPTAGGASASAADVQPETRSAADELAAAREAEERGDLDTALRHYDRALELDPKYAWAWTGRGVVLVYVGRYEDALSSYERALELDPKDAGAWYNRGNVL